MNDTATSILAYLTGFIIGLVIVFLGALAINGIVSMHDDKVRECKTRFGNDWQYSSAPFEPDCINAKTGDGKWF